jgi:hypothetical protein
VTLVALMARSKHRRAAVASRRAETTTSMTCPELVDGAVDRAPAAGDLHRGHPRTNDPDQVAAGSGGVGQQRRAPPPPPIDRDVVGLDTPLGEELLDVAVGQAEAQASSGPPARSPPDATVPGTGPSW